MASTTKRIAMWACPRTVSTALLRSFCQHSQVVGVDEPLYAYYLKRSGKLHPMHDEVMASQAQSVAAVVDGVLRAECDKPVQYVKHMAHHLFGDEDLSFIDDDDTTHAFLIRHPREMLPSLLSDLGQLERIDIAYGQQLQLFERLIAQGKRPVVVESTKLLANPQEMLPRLCTALNIEFEEQMMHWPVGSHSSYGVWAPAWYDKVMKTSGWNAHVPKVGELPSELEELFEFALPAYERLLEYSL